MKIHPVANTQNWQKSVLSLSTLSLALALSACGQKGQLYPAPAENPALVEPAVDNDMTPTEQPKP